MTPYLGDSRLKLVWLFAIRLHYFGAGTEHGLRLCNQNFNMLGLFFVFTDYKVEQIGYV